MTERTALLDYAGRLLDRAVDLGARGPRTAALLARSALEDWLDEQGARHGRRQVSASPR